MANRFHDKHNSVNVVTKKKYDTLRNNDYFFTIQYSTDRRSVSETPYNFTANLPKELTLFTNKQNQLYTITLQAYALIKDPLGVANPVPLFLFSDFLTGSDSSFLTVMTYNNSDASNNTITLSEPLGRSSSSFQLWQDNKRSILANNQDILDVIYSFRYNVFNFDE